MSALRTATGGRIDRARTLRFTFDGKHYEGHPGDTLASALLAAGVHLVGRSFKYHRPRGLLGMGAEEPNGLVGVSRGPGRVTPNLRMTQVELYEGLVAESQNRWPSLDLDVGEINALISRFIPAGFYYKTFMGPRSLQGAGLWAKVFEPVIRRAAGLGRAPVDPDPDRYANRYAHCDVLVVGAGPAGLAAALTAGASGKRVILCDDEPEIGGTLRAETMARLDGEDAATWLANTRAELAGMANVRVLVRTQAFGYYAQNLVALCERLTDHVKPGLAEGARERLWQVRAGHVVLATGSIERPLVFPGNDRPGIMLADGARTLLARYGVLPGHRIVVVTGHDQAYRAAIEIKAAGADVVLVADLRPVVVGPLPDAARAAGIKVMTGTAVTDTRGHRRVSAVSLAAIHRDGVATLEWVGCDCLLVSGGFTPSVHLFSQSRGKLRFDEGSRTFLPGTSAVTQAQTSAGACAGTFDLADALAEGAAAGIAASGGDLVHARGFAVAGTMEMSGGYLGAVPHGKNPSSVKAFVDFQNDVTAKDIALATREGFRSIEHIKRYTTTGMATDQGKTSNLNALAIAADLLGKTMPEVGLTTFRQPYTPVSFGSLAGPSRGDLFEPERRTPMHDWAVAHGAVFEDVGQWKRALHFARPGESMHAAVAREVKATRAVAGVFDASTLGKIEIVGPDAAEFMNRMYTNAWSKLGVGRCRYGLMLNEPGFVMDDGVVGRLAPDRVHVTTTTGGAPRVLAQMEDYLQTEFMDLKVWLTSTTEQWAVVAVQGPRARDILTPLIADIDLSAAAMPHMSLREGRICGVPTRLFRVSFTGELGFEVNVPADYGPAVWKAVWAQARPLGATVYGTEAMHVMRAEKGYIIVGQETDGTVTPDDLGLGWAVSATKPDFVGKRGLKRPDLVAPNRQQLVGLRVPEGAKPLDDGAQIVAMANAPRGTSALGHVTSSYFSPTLGHPIALAVVANGRARLGETLYVPMPEGDVAVTLVDPIFYDKAGERLSG